MVKLKNVVISNYRSCLNTRVPVNATLTTLIGVNGAGKSNILNAIQLLKSIHKSRNLLDEDRVPYLSKCQLKLEVEIDSVNYIIRIDMLYETSERNQDEIYSMAIRVREIGSRKWVEIDFWTLNYLTRSKSTLPSVYAHLSKKVENTVTAKIGEPLLKYFKNVSYYNATQFSDPTKCPISFELDEARPINRLRVTKTHEQFLYDLYNSYINDQSSYNRFIATVNKSGIGLIEDITFQQYELPSSSYKVKSGGKIEKIERSKSLIIPNIVVDDILLSPNQLSDGTFKTLALVYYIMTDLTDLLLIEEPEVGVHHGLLSSIIELIKFQSRQKQIFISTHSDFILDKLQPENVVLIRKDVIRGTIAESLPKTMTKNDYNSLREYLEESGNLGEYWKEGGFDNGQD